MIRRPLLAWSALALAVGALRLPMISLPGLGRDEATYLLWSHHPEPAYAPLLQALVAAGHALPPLLEARWPSIVAGALILVLFERLLARRGAAWRDRWIGVALVAMCPWQTYVGSILHPDDLQLAATLGFVVAARAGRPWVAVVVAALAPWTKPSGVLVFGVAGFWIVQGGVLTGRHRGAALALLAGLGLPPLFAWDADLVRGLLSFGAAGRGVFERVGLFVLSSVVLAGPALPLLGVRGLATAVRAPRDVGTVLGLAFVVAFGAAAVIGGQVKGNWMLPAILLLWPVGWTWRPGRAAAALVSTAALSAVIVLGFVRVDWARALEERWTSAPSYLQIAGAREAAVASASAWWHRLAEYRAFASDCPDGVEVLVTDDYGLAAQWAVGCPTGAPRLVVPLDPLFARRREQIPRGAMVLTVRHAVAELVGARRVEAAGSFAHPITGETVSLARVTDDP